MDETVFAGNVVHNIANKLPMLYRWRYRAEHFERKCVVLKRCCTIAVQTSNAGLELGFVHFFDAVADTIRIFDGSFDHIADFDTFPMLEVLMAAALPIHRTVECIEKSFEDVHSAKGNNDRKFGF